MLLYLEFHGAYSFDCLVLFTNRLSFLIKKEKKKLFTNRLVKTLSTPLPLVVHDKEGKGKRKYSLDEFLLSLSGIFISVIFLVCRYIFLLTPMFLLAMRTNMRVINWLSDSFFLMRSYFSCSITAFHLFKQDCSLNMGCPSIMLCISL